MRSEIREGESEAVQTALDCLVPPGGAPRNDGKLTSLFDMAGGGKNPRAATAELYSLRLLLRGR